MRPTLFALLAASLAFAAGCQKSATPPEDATNIQGKWKPVSVKAFGKEVPTEKLEQGRLVVEGDKLSFMTGDRHEESFSFTLDPSKNPKEIDMTALDREGQPVVRRETSNDPGTKDVRKGIYSLEGDNLKICFPDDAKSPRPTSIDNPAGEDVVITLQRQKEK